MNTFLAKLAKNTTVLALGVGMLGQAGPLHKAVALAATPIYISPDATSTKLGELRPGLDIGVQATQGVYTQIFSGANGVSGWIATHSYVELDNPVAPEVIFGAAVKLENEAESGPGEEQAAQDAARLYLSIYSDFPASARAAEALYRSASINWELKLSEEPRRRTPGERLFPDDSQMWRVVNKFSDTPWAARAAYQLIVEHFTCGDWYDKPSCVEKEADRYQGYVKKYPHGPMSAEAAYDALYREAIAWTLYNAPGKNHDTGKADQYQRAVAADAARMATDYPDTDWTAQAATLAFNVDHGMALVVPSPPPLGGP